MIQSKAQKIIIIQCNIKNHHVSVMYMIYMMYMMIIDDIVMTTTRQLVM